MTGSSMNGSRRRRLSSGGEASSSSHEGRISVVSTVVTLILAGLIAYCLIAPNQIDGALGRTASVVASKSAATNQVWTSVVSAITSDDVERDPGASSASLSNYAVLQRNETVATGDIGRIVVTQGHDILEIGPATTIAASESSPGSKETIIRLLDGIIHVKAAKRPEGETLSIETQYLVATVKGTQFDVSTSIAGTMVTVTEGLVTVRAAGSSGGIDVTPGNTAVISAAAGAVPFVGPTPASNQ